MAGRSLTCAGCGTEPPAIPTARWGRTRFRCGELLDPAGWEEIAVPDFLPPDDLRFYRELARVPEVSSSLL